MRSIYPKWKQVAMSIKWTGEVEPGFLYRLYFNLNFIPLHVLHSLKIPALWKEYNNIFNICLSTDVRQIYNYMNLSNTKVNVFYLTAHQYNYLRSVTWMRTSQLIGEETRCWATLSRLAAGGVLYASSHIQDNTYDILWPVVGHWLEREMLGP